MCDVRAQNAAVAVLVTLAAACHCALPAAFAQEAAPMPEVGQAISELTTPSQSDGATAEAQDRLQKALDRLREKYKLPALWAGKFYADGREVVACSGVRKWHCDAAAQTSDAVHIGSCTKAMTAVMIAQLCSNGSLSFATKLKEIFPEEKGLADSAWGEVTVDELLQHRSGAPANTDWQKLEADHPADAVAARRALLQWLATQKRPTKPQFVYSNVGYALLGHIVESIEGESWESLVVARVFEPLGMKSAGLGPLGETSENGAPAYAWGHTAPISLSKLIGGWFGGDQAPDYQPLQIDNPPPLGPAGRAHMSLTDWSKFVVLFATDAGPGKLGITPEIWSRLLKPDGAGKYAAGWILIEREWAGGPTLFHNGSNTTWYCVAFVAPKKGYCLLSATNSYRLAAPKACDQAVVAALELEF